MSFLRTPRGTFFESLVTCQSIPGLFGEEFINVSANIGPGQSSWILKDSGLVYGV